jgi:hypothetical protein
MSIQELRKNGSFLNEGTIEDVVRENRLQLVLVRCGGGRFLCPAQDAKHFIACVEGKDKDYIRDVSLASQN